MFGRSLQGLARCIYIYTRVEILEFSCRQPPVCRGAAPITLSAHSSTYPPVSCPRYFSSSFRRRRDTWERCAHRRLHLCTHGYVFATRPRISVEDRHTDISLSLSFFFSRARSFRNDRINRSNRCFVSLRNGCRDKRSRAPLSSSIDSRTPFHIFLFDGECDRIDKRCNNQSSSPRAFFV